MKTKLLIKTAYCGCLLLLVSALCATPASGQSKKNVAVYVTGDDDGTKKVIGAKLVAAITKDNEYAAVERTADFLAELSKEQNYQRSGAVDDSQITELGKQFGVDFVCVAEIINVNSSLFTAARFINVQSGLITATANNDKEVKSMTDLNVLSDNVAAALIASAKSGEALNKQRVAVYVTGDADDATKKIIGAKLVSAITKDAKYAAVERTSAFLSELSKEQGYQRSGAVADDQITQLGKQFGVDFVCVADLTNVLGSRFVSARLITVQTGVVKASAERDSEIKSMADLTGLAEDVADGLINNAPPCHRVDKPAQPYGCCKGLTTIDGVCRDMSRGYYWIYNGSCKTVRWYGTIEWDDQYPCPAGSSLAGPSELSCIVKLGTYPFSDDPYFVVSAYEKIEDKMENGKPIRKAWRSIWTEDLGLHVSGHYVCEACSSWYKLPYAVCVVR
jgi:peptidoglycan hydrolase-like protein with peptidoglycan-binding domain